MTPVSSEPPGLDGRTVLRQRWAELAYFHWPYEPGVVQALLPDGVYVDTFDDRAWVGLIPFEMRRVRLGPTPPLPWVGDFQEINVRTYVTDRLGRRAVWFFSLDVPRLPVVGVARTVFALPYCWARTEHRVHGVGRIGPWSAERDDCRGERHRYIVQRRWPRRSSSSSLSLSAGVARAEMSFRVADQLVPGDVDELTHFLTARWALLTTRRDNVLHGQVDHPRWPLHRVDELFIDQNLIEAAGLPSPEGPAHGLYSPGVDVNLAWLKAVPTTDRSL